jgi:hypothetical protein
VTDPIALFMQGQLSPAEQRAEARRTTAQAIKDSIYDLRQQSGAEQDRLRRELAGQQAFATTLAAYRTSDAAAMRSAYEQAAANVGGTSQALNDALVASQQGAVNTAQSDAARLAGFQGEIPGMASPAANAKVLSRLGITLPQETLGTIGTAEYGRGLAKGTAYANQLAGTYATEVINEKLRDVRNDYAKAIAGIEAKRPSMVQEAIDKLRENGRSDLATWIQAKYLQNTIQQSRAELTGRDPVTGKKTSKQRQQEIVNAQNAKELALKTQQMKRDAIEADRDWANSLAKLDLSERQYQLALQREARLRTASAKKGGFTAKQKNELRQLAYATASEAKNGIEPDANGEGGMDPISNPNAVLRDMLLQGIPYTMAIKAVERFYGSRRKWLNAGPPTPGQDIPGPFGDTGY